MAEKKTEEQANQANIDINKQQKLKEKVINQNKDDEVKQMTPAELRKQLSNKNSDYVFRLQKELEAQGKMSSEDAQKRIDALLSDLVVAQRHGQPASTYYNMSPKLKAADMLKPKKRKASDIPFWQYATDNAMFYTALFFGLFGLVGLFQKNEKYNPQTGVLTLLVIGVTLGVFMTKYNDWVVPSTGKTKKIPWSKFIWSSILLMVVLFLFLYIVSIPAFRIINPALPAIYNLIIAAAVYGIRWLFRKHYQIIGSAFSPADRSK